LPERWRQRWDGRRRHLERPAIGDGEQLWEGAAAPLTGESLPPKVEYIALSSLGVGVGG
jgi:hypothetical protein